MRTRTLACAIALALPALSLARADTPQGSAASSGYRLPPKAIVDIFDAPLTPAVTVSPDHRTLALLERRNSPTIAELAQPMYRLAGQRINPRANGPQQRAGAGLAITLRSVADGSERHVTVPASPHVGGLSFSPDGKRLSFTQTRDNGIVNAGTGANVAGASSTEPLRRQASIHSLSCGSPGRPSRTSSPRCRSQLESNQPGPRWQASASSSVASTAGSSSRTTSGRARVRRKVCDRAVVKRAISCLRGVNR